MLSPEDRERRKSFESKRKAHYNEFYAVKMARQLMEEDDDDDDEEEKEKEEHQEEEKKSGSSSSKTASKEDNSMEVAQA